MAKRLGTSRPAKDEFEVGCTYEHAGYLLTWLAAFFGPARCVTAFASCLHADKGIVVDGMAPDFAVGCIEYGDGVTARITCSLLGPKDKSLTIMGDEGVLTVPDVRNDFCPVYVRQVPPSRMRGGIERRLNDWRRLLRFPGFETDWHLWQRYPLRASSRRRLVGRSKPVDFCRGPAELAAAIREKRPCRLSARLGWHVTELVEGLQYPERFGYRRELASTFDSSSLFRATHSMGTLVSIPTPALTRSAGLRRLSKAHLRRPGAIKKSLWLTMGRSTVALISSVNLTVAFAGKLAPIAAAVRRATGCLNWRVGNGCSTWTPMITFFRRKLPRKWYSWERTQGWT